MATNSQTGALELHEFPDNLSLLVVGDLMLDRFIRGRVQRISPEAPVPVVEVRERSEHPGGAANVARNVAELASRCALLGHVGQDRDGDRLIELLNAKGIDASLITRSEERCTATKTRVVAGHQQIVRFDEEVCEGITEEDEQSLLNCIRENAGRFDAIIVEDYGKGLLTPGLVDGLRAMVKQGMLVCVDPNPRNKANWSGFSALKPNLSEACAAVGMKVDLDGINTLEEYPPLLEMVERLFELWNPAHLLLTVGEHGMVYAEESGKITHLPAKAREVFDVSGAGDTAIAAFAIALSAGRTGKEAAFWANQAASLVVAKLGTATVSRNELLEESQRTIR